MTKTEYIEAVKLLNKWSYHYYTLDNPIATDEEYDDLYFKIKHFEEENNYIHPLSPTKRVGDNLLEGFQKAKHHEKMYSLDDVFNEKEITDWVQKIKLDNIKFYIEPKFDGLSLNLIYENGILKQAITRGDGEIGEDVTANIGYIKGIPLSIPHQELIEIRGEVVIMKRDFDEINQKRKEMGDTPFSNLRNAAAGSLRNFNSKKVKLAKLHFTPYGIGHAENKSLIGITQLNIFKFIINQGFTNWGIGILPLCRTAEEIIRVYNRMHKERNNYPMLLDGMVIKVNNLLHQRELGFTSKFPKWAIAFKFPAIEKVTTLENVTFQVGKTGVITPVAHLKPINIDGAIVSKATLHNFKEIKEKDIRIGDQVIVIRSGDVIPKITNVFHDRRNGNEREILEPKTCPVCNQPTIKATLFNSNEDAVAIKCSNVNCPAVLKERLKYAVSKKALNIYGLGDRTIEELVNKNLIKKIADIYSLTIDILLTLEGFKIKKATKTYNSIQSSKNIELYRFLNALSIELVGERASKKIIASGIDIFDENLSIEDLIKIEDIGEAVAFNFINFFQNNKDEIIELKEIIQPKILEVKSTNKGNITDKVFVITGTLSQPRSYYANLIEGYGGKVTNSVSKKTDYLLAGEKAGSKLDKANKLEIKVLDEKLFLELLNS